MSEKPNVGVKMEKKLHDRAKTMAAEQERSVSGLIRHLLREAWRARATPHAYGKSDGAA